MTRIVFTASVLAMLLQPISMGDYAPPPFDWYSMAISPDGGTIAVVRQFEIEIWDVKSSKLERRIPGYCPVAFSPNGKLLAARSADPEQEELGRKLGRELNIWSVEDWKIEKTVTGEYNTHAIAFSPNSQLIVGGTWESGSDRRSTGETILWDLGTGKKLWAVTEKPRVISVSFSPDGKAVLIDDRAVDREVHLRDTSSGKTVTTVSASGEAIAVALKADGAQLLAKGSILQELKEMWGAQVGGLRAKLGQGKGCYGIQFSPNREYVMVSSRTYIAVWDISSEEMLWSRRIKQWVYSAVVKPDGRQVIVAEWKHDKRVSRRTWTWRVEINCYDVESGSIVKTLEK